jgi:hypothetical protein
LSVFLKRVFCTLRLMFYASLPARLSRDAAPPGEGEVHQCEPGQIRGGMERFLNKRGELRIFFPRCLAIAAPFVLFRLKREGFSRCTVQATDQGLYVQGRR